MAVYEWKRWVDPETPNEWEYTTTEGPINDPIPTPDGPGWRREYSFGISRVTGVGESPGRSVSSRRYSA